ncbi:MAG: response regulator transcription factor [Woeseiaceae bacterium]|nr:response regulator transcription factor [Woeseiaceae bacterium]
MASERGTRDDEIKLLNNRPENTISVLVVDDDVEFAHLLSEYLTAEGGFSATMRHDGASGVTAALDGGYDIIVLDVGLPELNGFEVLKRVRSSIATPVVMLTARGDDIDRILGLEIGADDYVPKPCNLRELVARIRAILRRQQRINDTDTRGNRVVIDDLAVEPGSQSVYLDESLVPLTSAEYLVLEALTRSPGRVVAKDSIARHALGRRIMPYDRSVDVHVGNLRKKLGPLDDGRQRIKTVRGRGYLYVSSDV